MTWSFLKLRWFPPLVAVGLFAFEARKFCGKAIYFIDDPFISMRFAANLVEHGELSFNPGDRVEGYSNLLHVLVHALTFIVRGGVPDAPTGQDDASLVVFGATVAELVLLGLLGRRATRGADRGPDAVAWYYAWILTLASWPVAFWASAGLETPIEGLLYVAILSVIARVARPLAAPIAWTVLAALLALVILVRFEGAIVALAMTAALAVHLVHTGRRRAAALLGIPVVLLIAGYHGWRIAYFGQLLPNTFVAKATGGSMVARLVAGASYCGGWGALLGGGVTLAALALAVVRSRALSWSFARRLLDAPVALVASVLVATKVGLVVWGGGDWMPGWRMLVPITPVAFFLMIRALGALAEGRLTRVEGGSAIVLGVALVLCGRANDAMFPVHDAIANEAGHYKKIPRGYLLVGDLLERSFGGGGEEIAIGEAGLIPFEARHVRFMDMFGLVDRDMATQPGGMHRRVHADHVIARAPGAVVFAHLHVQPPYGPYQYGGELLTSAAFRRAYRRVDLGAELETLGWAIYLRHDIDPAAHGLSWGDDDARVIASPSGVPRPQRR
jgi:hypothetical protein